VYIVPHIPGYERNNASKTFPDLDAALTLKIVPFFTVLSFLILVKKVISPLDFSSIEILIRSAFCAFKTS